MLSPMTRVGVVGLGNIGGAIAANLAADGHEVPGHRPRSGQSGVHRGRHRGRLRGRGGGGQRGHVHLVAHARGGRRGRHRVGRRRPPPDRSSWTSRPRCPPPTRPSPSGWPTSGHHFVEAPLTGGAIGAQGRNLVFMVGGDEEPVDRVAPLLDQLGRATFRMGPVGTGTTMKLVNSLLAFACTWASLEALSMAVSAGVDVRTAVEVVRTGGASNFFIDRAVEGINVRNKPVQFALGLAAKDAGLIQEVATGAGVSASIAAAMVEVLSDVVARGLGDHDWGDLVLAAEARVAASSCTIAPKAEG